MAGKGIFERIFKIEPGVTLSQWLYDRIANNWDKLVALFVAGGGMTYLAAITTWIKAWGPFGIGLAGLLSGLIAWIALSYAQSLRAKARLRHVEADAMKKWESQVENINPLAIEFHTKRIKIMDLKSPASLFIDQKRFIDCELIGPANLAILNSNLQGSGFMDCDVVVAKPDAPIKNAIALRNCNFLNTKIINCTIFIPIGDVPLFSTLGATFVSPTGNPQIDNQAPPTSQQPAVTAGQSG